MMQVSAKNLKHTGPAEKERVAFSATERAVGKHAIAAFAKRKGTEPSVLRVDTR